MRKKIILLLFLTTGLVLGVLLLTQFSHAQTSTSTNFQINNPVITSGQPNSTSSNYQIGQSVSQSVIGKSTSTNFQLWSGFQYFFTANSNTLTGTAGNSQVSLSWNAPQTFLGVNVGYYELGIGTSPGVYTYQNVGLVTNYTATGLTNGTTYYFKIKNKTLGGTTLSFSNETSATPSGSAVPGGGGGGGGTYGSGSINFSGHAYPNSQIFLLKDSALVSNTIADLNGAFQINSSGLSAGSFEFAIYAKDAQARQSALTLISTQLSANETKNITGIIISPTIAANNLEVKKGDNQNIFGFAQKLSKVTLTLTYEQTIQTFETESGPEGFYNFNLNTSKFKFGNYLVFSNSLFQNLKSQNSRTLEFIVGQKTIQVPSLTGCPAKGDLNNDCRVDLVDFSILAFWYLKPSFPKETDFNSDNIVDLVDFSILAYNWTG